MFVLKPSSLTSNLISSEAQLTKIIRSQRFAIFVDDLNLESRTHFTDGCVIVETFGVGVVDHYSPTNFRHTVTFLFEKNNLINL